MVPWGTPSWRFSDTWWWSSRMQTAGGASEALRYKEPVGSSTLDQSPQIRRKTFHNMKAWKNKHIKTKHPVEKCTARPLNYLKYKIPLVNLCLSLRILLKCQFHVSCHLKRMFLRILSFFSKLVYILFSEFLTIVLTCTFNTFVFDDFRFTPINTDKNAKNHKPTKIRIIHVQHERQRRQQEKCWCSKSKWKTIIKTTIVYSFWLVWTEKQSIQIRNLRNVVRL